MTPTTLSPAQVRHVLAMSHHDNMIVLIAMLVLCAVVTAAILIADRTNEQMRTVSNKTLPRRSTPDIM